MTELPLVEKISELDDRYDIFADSSAILIKLHKYKFNFSAKDNLCSKDFQTELDSRT